MLLLRETRIISRLEKLVEYSYACPVSSDAFPATPIFHKKCKPTANYGLILRTLDFVLSASMLPSYKRFSAKCGVLRPHSSAGLKPYRPLIESTTTPFEEYQMLTLRIWGSCTSP